MPWNKGSRDKISLNVGSQFLDDVKHLSQRELCSKYLPALSFSTARQVLVERGYIKCKSASDFSLLDSVPTEDIVKGIQNCSCSLSSYVNSTYHLNYNTFVYYMRVKRGVDVHSIPCLVSRHSAKYPQDLPA